MLGGVCVNTGTIPSKTLREAVLYLTGMDQREMYGQSYRVKDEITIADLPPAPATWSAGEIDVVRSQLIAQPGHDPARHGRFPDPHTRRGRRRRRPDARQVSAENIVIAHRHHARPGRTASSSTSARCMDSDGILDLESVPRSMVVVGAGVIGIEYASMFAALGTKVTVVEKRDRMLEFCDLEVVEALKYHLRDLAVTFRFGETVTSVEARPEGAIASLASGKKIPAETVMYSAGRQGETDDLDLDAAGLERRQARPDQGRRVLPDQGAAHLRGRRRHRLPRAGGDLDGAGPGRGLPRLRRAGARR